MGPVISVALLVAREERQRLLVQITGIEAGRLAHLDRRGHHIRNVTHEVLTTSRRKLETVESRIAALQLF